MNKQQWLHKVAAHAADLFNSGDFGEATGLMPHEVEALSEAEAERAGWAVAEVTRRLHRMGQQ